MSNDTITQVECPECTSNNKRFIFFIYNDGHSDVDCPRCHKPTLIRTKTAVVDNNRNIRIAK